MRARAARRARARVAAARRGRAAQVAQPPRVGTARERHRDQRGDVQRPRRSRRRGAVPARSCDGIVPAVVLSRLAVHGIVSRDGISAPRPARCRWSCHRCASPVASPSWAVAPCAATAPTRSCRSAPGQAVHRSPALDARVGAVLLRGRRATGGDGIEGPLRDAGRAFHGDGDRGPRARRDARHRRARARAGPAGRQPQARLRPRARRSRTRLGSSPGSRWSARCAGRPCRAQVGLARAERRPMRVARSASARASRPAAA